MHLFLFIALLRFILHCSAERKGAMYRSMLDTLARIHSVDVDRAGLGDYGVRVGSIPGSDPTTRGTVGNSDVVVVNKTRQGGSLLTLTLITLLFTLLFEFEYWQTRLSMLPFRTCSAKSVLGRSSSELQKQRR